MSFLLERMNPRLSEAERSKKYAQYAMLSPLNTKINEQKRKHLARVNGIKLQRKEFILDGVRQNTSLASVVPSYNAFNDRHAQTYFRQPAVQDMFKRAAHLGKGELLSPSMQSFKLSTRHRAPSTPNTVALFKRENRFVVDSVRTDSLKSKRNPIIPQYNALNDSHAQNYFRKRSVRAVLQQTCDVKF